MRGYGADLGEGCAGHRSEDEGDRDDLLGDHHEWVPTGQCVQGDAHRALHGVLDRHHRGIDIACAQGRGRGVDADERESLGVVDELGALTRRHLGERA